MIGQNIGPLYYSILQQSYMQSISRSVIKQFQSTNRNIPQSISKLKFKAALICTCPQIKVTANFLHISLSPYSE